MGNDDRHQSQYQTALGDGKVLSLMQLNLHRSRAPYVELQKLPFDIALVQEPNLTKKDTISMISKNVNYFGVGRARAAIIIQKAYSFWPMEPLSSRDLAVVALESKNSKQLVIASCYLDIMMKAPSVELNRLVQHCTSKQIPLIVGIDSNAHSTMWGESSTNKRGEDIERWLMQNDMYVLNNGSEPTFAPPGSNKRTVIDISIANRWAIDYVDNWFVDVEYVSMSDHKLISFNVSISCKTVQMDIRPYKKAEWSNFRTLLERRDPMIMMDPLQLEDTVDILYERLSDVLDLIAPRKVIKTSSKETWWTDSLTTKRLILKNMYKKRFVHERVVQKYRELKRDFNLSLRKARSESWKDFCTKAESATDISRLVQILENPPRRRMSVLQKDGVPLGTEDSLKMLLSTHFPDGVIGGDITPDPLGELDFSGVCQYISVRKIKAAFKSFGDYKSPGPDELPPKALKSLDEGHLHVLCLLYKLSIASGCVPVAWRRMKVVFLPKAGKSNYAIAKAYRPITLSNFMLKGLERLIQWYISEYIIKEPLFRQHAYTKGRSCETALSVFINDVEHAVYNKHHVLAVSLDCSGAFDCIRFDSAERGMRRKGLPNNIIRWYCNLLKGRLVTAEVQGCTERVVPARGSPQGGVLSPLIWNIIIDELLSSFKGREVKVIGYADDILLYVVGKDPTTLGGAIQTALDEVLEWGSDNGLVFNPLKTQAVFFTLGKRGPSPPRVEMEEVALEFSDTLTYLGVCIHRNLMWNRHIKQRTDKGRGLLMKCKNVIHQKDSKTSSTVNDTAIKIHTHSWSGKYDGLDPSRATRSRSWTEQLYENKRYSLKFLGRSGLPRPKRSHQHMAKTVKAGSPPWIPSGG